MDELKKVQLWYNILYIKIKFEDNIYKIYEGLIIELLLNEVFVLMSLLEHGQILLYL